MSEYTLVSKRRPQKPRNVPVVLDEYMIFSDKNETSKALVLMLKQKSSVDIDGILIQIKQLDSTGDIISVANYAFNELVVKPPKNLFIPEKKIMLYDECADIEYQLLKAESSSMIWENDTWTEIEQSDEEEIAPKDTFVTKSIKPITIKLPLLIPMLILLVHIIILISVFFVANIQ